MTKASEATLPAKLCMPTRVTMRSGCMTNAVWSGVSSVIKPARQRADGTRSGFWRSRMSESYLTGKGYGSRWAVESFFGGLKRTGDGFDP